MLTAKAVIALSMLFLVSAADAADLPRRAALGVALAPLPKSSSGVLVRSVFLGLTAQKIGIREGDVILQVNAQKAKAVGDVVAAAASLHAGDKVDVTVDFNCQGVVNPPLDTAKYLPRTVYPENYGNYDDDKAVELYNTMLHEADPAKQRVAMCAYEKHVLDTQAHAIVTPWWYRILPHRSYLKGWKISPSHYINQDLANVWLDK